MPQLGYTSPITSTVIAMRCPQPLAVQVASGGVATTLPTGAVLYLGIKLPGAIKGDWLANCRLTASSDPESPGLWTQTLQLNTPEMVAAMHGDPDDPMAELTGLPCLAEYYYTVPGQSDPICALNYNLTVNAPLYNAPEAVAPSPNIPLPPVDQIDTKTERDDAIALAVADTAAVNDSRIVGAVQKVDSVAALRALPVPTASDSGQVELRGYYSAGDGGGGSFYWDAAYTYLQPLTVTMGTGGSGYHVHDLLQVGGGTALSIASSTLVDVLSVDGNGAVLTYAVLPGSSYRVLPVGQQGTIITHAEGAAHAPSGATFAVASSKPDDGGLCICPTGYTGAGRWRRLVDSNCVRNVLWWGAQFANIYGADVDSYDAINAAIASLPNIDFSGQDYPGAGRTGHQKRGEIYFPPHPIDAANFGFEVRDTVYVSCSMTLRGEAKKSRVAFTSNAAPSASAEKWVVRCLYSGSSNETFFIDIIGLIANGRRNNGNPGSSGVYYIGCNGGKMTDCGVETVGLRGFLIDSAGCYLNNLLTGDVLRGPGLTATGQQIVAGYLDIEHVNYAQALGGSSTTIYYDPSDGNNDPYPAVLLSCSGSHFALITTEASPLPLKFQGSPNTTVETLVCNTYDYLRSEQATPATASIVKAYNSDHIAVHSLLEQGDAQWAWYVRDLNNGFGNCLYSGDGVGPRGTYIQKAHVAHLDANGLTVVGDSTFSHGPLISANDAGTADQLQILGNAGHWSFLRAGGQRSSASHEILQFDPYDRVLANYGFLSTGYTLIESNPAYLTVLSVDADHALCITSNADGITRKLQTTAGTSSPLLNPVADDDAKHALTGIAAGYTVQVASRGGAIEMYNGGTISDDSGWNVIDGTINLTVINQCQNTPWSFNENAINARSSSNLGWVFMRRMVVDGPAGSGFCVSFFAYNNGTSGGYTLPSVVNGSGDPDAGFTSEVEVFVPGPFAPTVNFPDRCPDAFLIITDADPQFLVF